MPDDILAVVYPRLPARSGNGDGIVNRKPGVLPGEYLQRETACRRIAAEQSPVNKQFYYSPPENLGELCGIIYRDVVERTCFIDPPFQNDAVNVWIPSHQIAKRRYDTTAPVFTAVCTVSV